MTGEITGRREDGRILGPTKFLASRLPVYRNPRSALAGHCLCSGARGRVRRKAAQARARRCEARIWLRRLRTRSKPRRRRGPRRPRGVPRFARSGDRELRALPRQRGSSRGASTRWSAVDPEPRSHRQGLTVSLSGNPGGMKNVADRLGRAYDAAAYSGPFARHVDRRWQRSVLATHEGDAAARPHLAQRAGCARAATVMGPLEWAPITRSPKKHRSKVRASRSPRVTAGRALRRNVAPMVVPADGCEIGLLTGPACSKGFVRSSSTSTSPPRRRSASRSRARPPPR